MLRNEGGGQLDLTPVAVLINVKLTKSDFLLMSHKVDTLNPETRLYVRVAKMASMLDCPFVVGGARFSINGPLGIQARKSNLQDVQQQLTQALLTLSDTTFCNKTNKHISKMSNY